MRADAFPLEPVPVNAMILRVRERSIAAASATDPGADGPHRVAVLLAISALGFQCQKTPEQLVRGSHAVVTRFQAFCRRRPNAGHGRDLFVNLVLEELGEAVGADLSQGRCGDF